VGNGGQLSESAPNRKGKEEMTRPPFTFRGTTFEHFDHAYNRASLNMRSAEIPIVRRYLADKRKRILEIGNVLSHYQATNWPVIDIQEKGERVHNVDVMAFKPKAPFDLIVAISTLEHVGQGKYAKYTEPVTLETIVKHIRGMLAPHGVFVATVPLGYNEMVDKAVRDDKTGADRVWYVCRVGTTNTWTQCNKTAAMDTEKTHWSNAFAVLQSGWFAWDVLNVGAGNKIIPHAVNHDLHKHRPEIDVTHDLNDLPWPWADNSFDKIISCAVFEHLDIDLVKVLNECWRILRPEGICHLKLPHWNSESAHDDCTHRWFYGLGVLDQFDPDTKRGQDYSFYTPYKWKIIKRPELNRSQSSFAAQLRVRK